ncbi:hypothetical protein QL285_048640 [Trifolium repens]|nr:hypothetical protein QL285_048640 [Trifolium repens]
MITYRVELRQQIQVHGHVVVHNHTLQLPLIHPIQSFFGPYTSARLVSSEPLTSFIAVPMQLPSSPRMIKPNHQQASPNE